MHPAIADIDASSYRFTWLRSSQITSFPWCVQILMEIRFPMQPVGTNSAASFPKISAARFSSLLTVGSSPYTPSPPSALSITPPPPPAAPPPSPPPTAAHPSPTATIPALDDV